MMWRADPWRMAAGAALAAAMCVAVPAESLTAQEPDLSTDAVVRAASVYVEAYRKSVASLLADETYLQLRQDGDGQELERRSMTGELFLTYVEADGRWVAVHDVLQVEGEPVADRDDLQSLLRQGGTLRGIARRVTERNAEFNIGGVWRNFNEPTLALLLLEPDRVSDLRFERTRITRGSGATLVTLEFEERREPTLVRGPRGPIRATGEITIEAGTGRVRRTLIELRQGDIRAELVTTYAHDERLDMWLPSVFTERYEGDVEGTREVIACEATYTNYRRFTATGRIKRSR